MALREGNNPQITGPILSHEITKLVAEHSKANVARILQKRKKDVVVGLVALSEGECEGEGERSEWKRCTFSHDAIVNKVLPLPNETQRVL